jgi:uncharacterized RDD family membrane protein YckC
MQNPPPPPPPGGYSPPPPPPPGGYSPPPPPPPGGYSPPPPPPPGGYQPPAPPPQPAGYPAPQGYGYTPQVTYGGFWIRFVAVIIDGFIIAIPIIILAVILGVAAGVAAGVSSNSTGQATSAANGIGTGLSLIVDLVAFVLTIGYFVYFWGTGSTLGMRLFHLRVVDANTGAPIGFGRAALRYLGYIVSGAVCYIGLIWAAFDPRKQGWHDKIANTVVLQG